MISIRLTLAYCLYFWIWMEHVTETNNDKLFSCKSLKLYMAKLHSCIDTILIFPKPINWDNWLTINSGARQTWKQQLYHCFDKYLNDLLVSIMLFWHFLIPKIVTYATDLARFLSPRTIMANSEQNWSGILFSVWHCTLCMYIMQKHFSFDVWYDRFSFVLLDSPFHK